ncbi:hypothetical protein DPMN_058038 [Dreissena polymorpha]|uniref:Uncharacterized protein n=1 Tax=Dreissena polymorpha TaxID=45954 RepID=A0A9D4C120_DREPO|nr:hypothetical protein DPMN_058038 [Dreissena polymorpha]
MPEGESDTAIAENFDDHFLDKINKIRDALASFQIIHIRSQGNEVKKIINHLQTKSCELDALPARLSSDNHLVDGQTDRQTDRQTDMSKAIYPLFFEGGHKNMKLFDFT